MNSTEKVQKEEVAHPAKVSESAATVKIELVPEVESNRREILDRLLKEGRAENEWLKENVG